MVATEILHALQSEPRQTPAMLTEKLKMNHQVVRNVLGILQELRLVETPARGLYEITALGEQVLRKTEA